MASQKGTRLEVIAGPWPRTVPSRNPANLTSPDGRIHRDLPAKNHNPMRLPALWMLLAFAACQPALAQTIQARVPAETATARWTALATTGSPTARHETAMVARAGKAYLVGGRGVKPVEEFNPSTNTWRQLNPTPLEIHHFQPVAYGDLIYVVAAMTGRYPKETPLETVYLYDADRDAWRKGPAIPPERRRGGRRHSGVQRQDLRGLRDR